ncbi:MAG: pyrroline-5-carboxylate reductase [Hespellia sp.]|nr:pyrroline-5-carboxylate reductase [Hespellia sp.]
MKLGFIGCGNMAKAILGGVLKSNIAAKEDVMVSAAHAATIEKAAAEFGVKTTLNNAEVAKNSDVIILAVKPMYYEAVIAEIAGSVSPEQIFISIAPGKTIEWIAQRLGEERKIVRTMPNTPALVGEGMTAVCYNEQMEAADKERVMAILNSFGKAEEIKEYMMDAVVAVSGSSPAYVYMFIEAMADAAVAEGLPRAAAYEFAAQAVYGSAKMVLETGLHPGVLKDQVCSPGGTTIQAVEVLEKQGMRSAVMEAMTACAEKSRKM